MAQWLKALINCSHRGPEISSPQPHGGSQPPVLGSDALFCVSEDSGAIVVSSMFPNSPCVKGLTDRVPSLEDGENVQRTGIME